MKRCRDDYIRIFQLLLERAAGAILIARDNIRVTWDSRCPSVL